MSELPNQTVDTIARAVSNAFQKIMTAAGDNKTAQDAVDAARLEAANERDKVLITLAAASTQHKWDSEQIEQGVAAAQERQNDKKNTSLNTFASEVRKAMRPGTRAHVAAMFELAQLAWDAEGALDKKAEKPLRKAFARKYHLVVNELFPLAQAGQAPTTVEELGVLAHKKLRAKELDAGAVFSRIKAIREQLAAFQRDFPVDGIDVCVEYLNEVTVEDLKNILARNAATVTAPVTPEPENTPEHDDAGEPAQGPSDILADVLQGMAA